MKFLVTIILILCFCGCKQNAKKSVHGSWTTVLDSNPSTPGFHDSVVFTPSGDLKVYYIVNDRLADSFLAKFEFDEKSNQLLTKYDTSKFSYEVVELTADNLVLKAANNGVISKYKRLNK